MKKMKLTAQPWSDEISPLLTANFIEMGYGLQVECMSAPAAVQPQL